MAASLFDGTVREHQWQVHHMQLINWGTFDGEQRIDFACDFDGSAGTVVCGGSGTGKSTLQDAYDEVIMRRPRFNAATNAGGGEKDKRNLATYVRGVLDAEYDRRTGEYTVRSLRDGSRARWTAIGVVFSDSMGDYFTAARLYYLEPGCEVVGQNNTWFVTAGEDLDLRALEQAAGSKFDKRSIARALPLARQHEGRGAFLDCVYRSLGLGGLERGSAVTALLAKIRAGKDFGSVSALFSDLVLEEPGTYELANRAVEQFDSHTAAYKRLKTSAEKLRLLEPITAHKNAYDDAQEMVGICQAVGSLDDPGSALAAWLKARRGEVVGELIAGGENARADALGKLDEARSRSASAREEVKRLEEQVAATGGDLAALEARIAAAGIEYGRRDAAYGRLVAAVSGMGLAVPRDGVSYKEFAEAARMKAAACGEDMRRLDEEFSLLAAKEGGATKEACEVRENLAYYSAHGSNLPRALAAARDGMARAAGMAPEDLPFAAELMDLTPGEEEWRQALEGALHDLSRTVLVDRERLKDFRRSIEAVDPRERVKYMAVDLGDGRITKGREGGLASKITLKPGNPFAAGLSRIIADGDHDALCVETAADLRDDDLRVTRRGQVCGTRDGAHGRREHEGDVIGFSNEAKVEALARRADELAAELRRVRGEKERNRREREASESCRAASLRVAETPFSEVDAEGALAELSRLEHEREELLRGNIRLHELKRRLKAAEGQADIRLKEEGVCEGDLRRIEAGLETLRSIASGLAGAKELAGHLPERVTDHIAALATGKERSYADARDLHKSFNEFSRQVNEENRSMLSKAERGAEGEKKALEDVFAEYQRRWPDPNRGTGIDSYEDYAAVLGELLNQGVDVHRRAWKESMRDWIRADLVPLSREFDLAFERIQDRIDPINGILRTLTFGAEGGTLRLGLEKREATRVKQFRSELAALTGNATSREFDAEDFCGKAGGLLDRLRLGCAERDALLDRRRHVKVFAQVVWPEKLGRKDGYYDSFAAKSGGEVQELVAFLSASALLYRLGTEAGRKPGFAPVMLDESFSLADSEFTARACRAWKAFGFQRIMVASQDKFQSVAPFADECVYISKNREGASRVTRLMLDKGAVDA